MSKNIMLMGFSGSGKTTLSNHISENFGQQQIISSDIVHTKLRQILPFIFKEWETNINSTSYKITQITTKIIQMTDMIIKSRSEKWVIYDACNLTENTRQKMWKILWNHFLIEVTAEEKDLLERLNNRENPEVWKELHKKQKQDYEPTNPNLIYNTSTENLADFDKKFFELLAKNSEK